MTKIIQTSGTRKKAIARATLRDGSGIIRINNINLDNYSPQMLRMKLREPLLLAKESADKVDIDVFVNGGGISSQAEAARLAIARAIADHSKGDKVRNIYLKYDRHLLVADVRQNEPSKPNDSKPRAKRQKSYR